ncbi:glycosyltransferase family 2 protein [Niabella yanshanensis]|uniref:Glycosyltransferase family 2 protein n=1 Tax=Niabella yanshanensis TaxID=577386 RepID=A0ABZ0WCD7_9BACT|nr:glycosyltransferase family 2 protein [Niabella yanshanensis]WQD40438.1 glycosyltransferase family 2 protein [Niabella yanshanensis]
MLLFDIVIPTYNNLEELKQCLESLERQTLRNFKVWVAVDGSTDATLEYLSLNSFNFPLSWVEHSDKKNHGRAATRNLVLPHLTANYVLFLDSDLTVQSDFVSVHYAAFKVSGGYIISLGKIQYERGDIWGEYDMTRGMNRFQNNLAEIPAKYILTGNVSMPASLFVKLNGFDEGITTYGGEDTELGCRMQKEAGVKVLFNKQAVATGVMDKPLSFALQQREAFANQGLKYLLKKHPWADDVFQLNFLTSWKGKILYHLIPRRLLMQAAENRRLPLSLRIKTVHLLVFYHLYKGYHH